MKKYGLHLAAGVVASLGMFLVATVNACSSVTCADDLTCMAGTPDGGGDSLGTDHHIPPDGRQDGHRETGKDSPSDGRESGPSPCPKTDTPHNDPCVINDAYGVFVAPIANGGSDSTGDGTRARPYATLGFAIPSAVMVGKRVYACAATYAEAVSIGSTADGIEIYGGLQCPAAGDGGVLDAGNVESSTGPWSYNGMLAVVAPTLTGYALDVESLTKGARFEDMSFTALAANLGHLGESSIGVLVNGSVNVTFTRVSAKAGDGAAGVPGMALPTNMCATSLVGAAASGLGGGNPGTCTCPVTGSSAGGAGGAGAGTSGTPGIDGGAKPGTTLTVPFYDGKGGQGAIVAVQLCGNGDDGANASPQSGGLPGAAGLLKSGGWQSATAGSGMPGDPGQGGGGGGGSLTVGGAGGGGGGCGGNGGAGGGGGGASIAIALVGSTVKMNAVTLQTGTGGTGGTGAQGEPGQAGGTGGSMSGQCNGGIGGQGAGGSGGGGGAGGPSVGVAWSGSSAPQIDGKLALTDISLASPSAFTGVSGGGPGAGGLGGLAATGGGNPGVAGNGGTAGPMGDDQAVDKF
jgi:hypothetical protein